jgi:4-hydroxymandelate oxidase
MTVAGDYEMAAKQRLHPAVYDYFAGGADDQVTVRDNARAWQRVRLRPRVLRDVAEVDMRAALLGAAVAAPIGVAPMAAHRMVHPDGECATARGAAAADMLYVVSTMSTCSMEDVAEAAPGAPRWFQLYVRGDLQRAHELIQRAQDSGYSALVVTVDVPTLGFRRHETVALEDRVELAHFPRADGATDGAYDRHVALTFEDLATIVSWTTLPVLAKGVLRADDAAACVRAGVAGIVVSNHGGRQLDTTVDPPTALAEVASAIGDVAEIYVDGGIRRGTDVVKALALGAHGVLVGRPTIWGLAARGADGVTDVLRELAAELERALRLCGVRTLDELTSDLVVGPS